MAGRLFLERRTYRQTRLQDAARLLPVLGLILLFGPIFIRDEDAAGAGVGAGAGAGAGAAGGGVAGGAAASPDLAGGMVYYFSVWLGLIVLTALVSRALMGASTSEPDAAAQAEGATVSVPEVPAPPIPAGPGRSGTAEGGGAPPAGHADGEAPAGPAGREGG